MKKILCNTEYQIVSKIAEGGMGAVYKAQKMGAEGFEKTVAIKTLLECYSKDQRFIDKFVSEAKLVANLVHENIVQIYQLDCFKGEYYFVLEFVNGISLFNFMDFLNKARGCLPEKLAVFIASRVARGLAYAHSRCDASGVPLKIVHCDVCPHNIMITTEGLPKLTDFGIARAVTMSSDDSVAGKLPFMSPEQALGKEVDFRSDIYSLGTVLFYMLCGRHSRRTDVGMKEVLKEAQQNTVHWEFIPDSVDDELLEILSTMLATNPDDRYQDTSELARSLEYHIYKDGYGPTIVTLSEFMQEQMPALFHISDGYQTEEVVDPTPVDEVERTQVISMPDRTQVMSPAEVQPDGSRNADELRRTQRIEGMAKTDKDDNMVFFPNKNKMTRTMELPKTFFKKERMQPRSESSRTAKIINWAKKTAKTMPLPKNDDDIDDKTQIMDDRKR